MSGFSSDADLARYEPGVFDRWILNGQVLCRGTNGRLAGTQFAAGGADFTAAQVKAGHILWLQSTDGSIAGAYEIVQVPDSGHLTVSVLRADPQQPAIPAGAASGLLWRIVSYDVQAYEVQCDLQQRLGLTGTDWTGADSRLLRRPSVFGTLALVFEALDADGQEAVRQKKDYYRCCYQRAVEGLCVPIDADGDGQTDTVLRPWAVKLARK